MSEIKLRVWNKELKKMFTLEKHKVCIMDELWWIDKNGKRFKNNKLKSLIILQFTGLIDKNGKEVYEGDIVKCWKEHMELDREHDYDWISGFGIAIIENHGWGFYFKEISQDDKSGWFFVGPETNEFYPNGKDQTIEVIGNIYENQKLLENDNIK